MGESEEESEAEGQRQAGAAQERDRLTEQARSRVLDRHGCTFQVLDLSARHSPRRFSRKALARSYLAVHLLQLRLVRSCQEMHPKKQPACRRTFSLSQVVSSECSSEFMAELVVQMESFG